MRLRPALVVWPWLASLGLVVLLAASGGCNDQGEGQVCDVNATNNGSDDCQNGLTCQEAPGAHDSANPFRCCPGDLNLATTPVCTISVSTGDASSAPPPVLDGSTDGASDGAFDGQVVIGIDASSDGGATTDGASGDVAADAADGAAAPDATLDGATE